MTEIDYEELVEGTIDEVKERVEEDGLNPKNVLKAEKRNKDRVTLVEWLEERVEDESGEERWSGEESPGSRGFLGRAVEAATSRMFVAGLLVGIALAVAALSSGMGAGGGLSPAEAGDRVETYFSQNAEGIPLQSMRVESVQRMEGSNLYRLDMVLSAEFLNRTVEQNQTAVVDSNARYLFLSLPIDTERPLSEQIGGAGQGAAP